MPDTKRYECDGCGACCRQLIVEADQIDLHREPRLINADPNYRGSSFNAVDTLLNESGRMLIIACGCTRPCRFLDAQSRCRIYPTRPNDCVALQPGDEQCQWAREAEGMPPLEPIDEIPSSRQS